MTGLNKVLLIGYLGQDPEMRVTPSGTALVTLNVAVSRTWRDDAGELQQSTEWVRVVAWQRLAEVVSAYLSKGNGVYIAGRLTPRSREGARRAGTPSRAAGDVISAATPVRSSPPRPPTCRLPRSALRRHQPLRPRVCRA